MSAEAARALGLRWKAATRQAVQDAGGLAEAARACGLSSSQLSRCQLAHEPGLLGVCEALRLAEHSGTRGFAEIFADLAGCRLAEQPDGEAACGVAAVAAAMSEAAELVHVTALALADGVITPSECAGIRRVVGDLRDVLADLERALPAAPLRAARKGGARP